MKSEKKFLIPNADIVEFDNGDIILTSDVGGIVEEGSTPDLP